MLGRDDVSADRHDAFGDFRHQLVNIHIARQNHKFGRHLPLRGFHHSRIGVRDVRDHALLKNTNTRVQRGTSHAQRVFERVQMCRVFIQNPCVVAFGRNPFRHFIRLNFLQMRIIVRFAQAIRPFKQTCGGFGLDARGHIAVYPVAIYVVLTNALTHQIQPFDGQIKCTFGLIHRHGFFKRLFAAGITGNRLPTIAPRSAPRDAARLEQHHIKPRIGQFQCRGQSGQPRANHTNIGGDRAF